MEGCAAALDGPDIRGHASVVQPLSEPETKTMRPRMKTTEIPAAAEVFLVLPERISVK